MYLCILPELHLWLQSSNFFNPSKKNFLVVLQIGRAKDLLAPLHFYKQICTLQLQEVLVWRELVMRLTAGRTSSVIPDNGNNCIQSAQPPVQWALSPCWSICGHGVECVKSYWVFGICPSSSIWKLENTVAVSKGPQHSNSECYTPLLECFRIYF
jgi:hypothetical protein